MRRDIYRRIGRLEQEAGITAATPLPNIFFYFVDQGNRAHFGDRTWDRKQGEQGREFEARILVELETGGGVQAAVLVFIR